MNKRILGKGHAVREHCIESPYGWQILPNTHLPSMKSAVVTATPPNYSHVRWKNLDEFSYVLVEKRRR